MSTYTQDFSEYTIGLTPSDWTNRWGTNWAHLVEAYSEGYGDKRLNLNADTADQRRLLSWDDIDVDSNRANSEVLLRVRASANTGPDPFFISIRGGGSPGSEEGYQFRAFGDDVILHKYVAGVSTNISTGPGLWPYSTIDDYWYWMRFRVNGASLKGKLWRYDEEEPQGWALEATDEGITAAGWVGVGGYESTDPDMYVDHFSVGTNGDSPALPVDATANIRANQQLLQVGENFANPKVRANQQFLQVGQSINPLVRANQQFLQVAYAYAPSAGEYVVVCINT